MNRIITFLRFKTARDLFHALEPVRCVLRTLESRERKRIRHVLHAAKCNGIRGMSGSCGDRTSRLGKRNILKGEGMASCLRSKQHSVYIQADFIQVGVNRNRCRLARALVEASAIDMDEGLFSEPCLVNIERVLLDLAIHGDKAFIVPSLRAALLAEEASEIKHVPDKGPPDPRTGAEHFQCRLMHHGLIFLSVIHLDRVLGMVGQQGITSVFADRDSAIRILRVIFICPLSEVIKITAVPAEVMVPGFHITDLVKRVIPAGRIFMRDDRQAVPINALDRLLKILVTSKQLRIVVAADKDLIA